MKENIREAGVRSIGLTIWPLYAVESVGSKDFHKPFAYQNGGDWPWWGGRIVQGLAVTGLVDEAEEVLIPILEMVEEFDGFYEWHGPDGTPHGSKSFRGAAGAVCKAIRMLSAEPLKSYR